jgi:TolA-binding protein
MEIHSLKLLVPCVCGLLVLSPLAKACGPFFEEAPPTLPYYLDRLPAKSLGDLYVETKPQPKSPPPDANAIADIPGQVGKVDRKKLIGQVDQLLAQARANYENGEICNELNDFRDTLSSRATDAEVADYLQWRVTHATEFSVLPPPGDETYDEKPPVIDRTPMADDIEKRAETASPQMKPQWLYARGAIGFCAGDRYDCAKWFERVWKEFPDHPRAEAALFLSARCAFRASRDNPWNGPSMDAAPPTDKEKTDDQMRKQKFDDAEALFHQYLKTYPHGRFAADAYGWLGALDLGCDDNAAALDDYIQQVETPGHPEVAKSALFMCQDVLSGAKAGDEALFALVARHPLVAMGATYFALETPDGGGRDDVATGNVQNAPYSDETDEYRDDTAQAKKWRQRVLPRLAAEVATQKRLYESDHWPSRYLAMLAQAASAGGRQDEALAITDVPASQLDASDDLLLARGIALQRANRPGDAIAVYRTLLVKFPRSPLAQGVKLKLALALQDSHQAGLAILVLQQLSGSPDYRQDDEVYPPGYAQMQFTDSPVSEDISNAAEEQVGQIIDALYNFAPINELAAALNDPAAIHDAAAASQFARGPELIKQELNAVLAERCLADEDFAGARRYLAAARPLKREDLANRYNQPQNPILELPIYLNNQPAIALSGSLESLTRQVETAIGAERKAKAIMDLGDAWAAARGKFLGRPLDGEVTDDLFDDNADQAMIRRRDNGRALEFKDVDEVLESRDELRHAARWWMRAARLVPGTQLAATARLKALDAIPRIADGSDFAFLRDVETNATATSRELYQRLRTECPNTVEAQKQAAYWSFPMHQLVPGGHPYPKFDAMGDRVQDAIGQMGYAHSDYSAFDVQTDFVEEQDTGDSESNHWVPIYGQMLALQDHATNENATQLAKEVETIRGECRERYNSLGESRYFNVLDDLALFLKEPNLTQQARSAYIELRLRVSGFASDKETVDQWKRIGDLWNDPALAPYADYVDFLKAWAASTYTPPDSGMSGGVFEAETSSYQTLEQGMRDYLSNYPKSPKREAAALMLARAVHWLTTPHLQMWSEKDDETDPAKVMDDDITETLTTRWREKFDYKRAKDPLDKYDAEYPNGRYSADIRIYRGSAAMRGHDWPAALDAAIAGVKDKTHPELQPEASLLLANILAQLADAESRPALLQAIRQRPEALRYLQAYLAKTWQYKDHPLRYLGDYLGDQLGFHLKEPPIQADDQPNS